MQNSTHKAHTSLKLLRGLVDVGDPGGLVGVAVLHKALEDLVVIQNVLGRTRATLQSARENHALLGPFQHQHVATAVVVRN